MEYDLTKLSHSDYENYLIHYGILGMKWGVRRYQNKDGTLTAAGKKRYEEIERQAKIYDDSAASNDMRVKRARDALADIKKNGKKSKYFNEYVNPDDEWTVKNAKDSAKMDIELYEELASTDRKVAENIRNTKLGSKTVHEIAKQKNTISKGSSWLITIGGTAAALYLSDKGYISTGQVAVLAMISASLGIRNRLKTATSASYEIPETDQR